MSRAAILAVLVGVVVAGTILAAVLPLGSPVRPLVLVVLFGALGVGILAASFAVLDAVTVHDLEKQIFEEKNVAAAIVVGSAILATGAIVCAAIVG